MLFYVMPIFKMMEYGLRRLINLRNVTHQRIPLELFSSIFSRVFPIQKLHFFCHSNSILFLLSKRNT